MPDTALFYGMQIAREAFRMLTKFLRWSSAITAIIWLVGCSSRPSSEPENVVFIKTVPDIVVATMPYEGKLDGRMKLPFDQFIEAYKNSGLEVTPPEMIIKIAPDKYLFGIQISHQAFVPKPFMRVELKGGKNLTTVNAGLSGVELVNALNVYNYMKDNAIKADPNRFIRELYWKYPFQNILEDIETEIQIPIQ